MKRYLLSVIIECKSQLGTYLTSGVDTEAMSSGSDSHSDDAQLVAGSRPRNASSVAPVQAQEQSTVLNATTQETLGHYDGYFDVMGDNDASEQRNPVTK